MQLEKWSDKEMLGFFRVVVGVRYIEISSTTFYYLFHDRLKY